VSQVQISHTHTMA